MSKEFGSMQPLWIQTKKMSGTPVLTRRDRDSFAVGRSAADFVGKINP